MKVDALPDELPEVLYHYTDSVGLQGILGPGSGPLQVEIPMDQKSSYVDNPDDYTNGKAARFWASDVRYMNDSLELRFGADIVSERLNEASGDNSLHIDLRAALAGFAKVFDPARLFSWPFRCFSVCFCDGKDLLSQWRGYAGGIGGFAIGFPRDVLEYRSHGILRKAGGNVFDMESHARLVKVAYGEEAARARADHLVRQLTETFDAGRLLPGLNGAPSMTVAIEAFRTIAGVKHAAFAEEREWRLLAITDRKLIKTRGRAGGLVPYMDVVVNSRLGLMPISEYPVRQIVVGPTPTQGAQVAAVRDLLESRGTWRSEDVDVVPSNAPFLG